MSKENEITQDKKEKIERLLKLGEEIYNQTGNAEAIMFLAYAWGTADANKQKSA